MPYICTMQACEAEKVELRKEIERLRALLRAVLHGKHSKERANCEVCNALVEIEAELGGSDAYNRNS